MLLFSLNGLYGQEENGSALTVTYEEVFDAPSDINKLFVALQPLYGELFVTNVNVGFGIEAQYFLKDKADFKVHYRKTYSQKTDLERDAAEKASTQSNSPKTFGYFELGGTYHFVDREEESTTRMILVPKENYRKTARYKVPEHTLVPSKVRKIYGGRLGLSAFQSSTELNQVLEDQGITLTDPSGTPIDSSISLFTNVTSASIYIGGSLTWIKNFAIKPSGEYESLVNDQIFTVFLDLLIAPSVNIEDVVLNGVTYSTDEIKTKTIGMRVGMEGKFNRDLGWAYGAEIGFRPSIEDRGFYALVKMSFPVFSTKLAHSKEAVGN